MVKVGEHITLDIIGTKREYSPSFFEKLLYKIAKKAKVTVLEISTHKFEPQGFTLVALLAESHMSFHTFPEKNIISFDFFTCAKVSPVVALNIIKKEIEKETENAQKEIKNFKINSINKINLISEEIASNLVKDIFGEDPNKSSVKAIVNEIMKGHKF